MGQYYKPTNLDKKEYLYTHEFKQTYTRKDGSTFECGQGLKLMEHSYIGNPIMNAVENMIIPSGNWHKTKLVWAGDYADKEAGYPMKKDGKDEYEQNIYTIMEDTGKNIHPSTDKVDKKYRYLTNYTRKEVVDLKAIKKDKNGYKIHPLSLLICEGNGRGGGDYEGDLMDMIGLWARNIIGLEETIQKGFEIIEAQFEEDYE